MLNLRNYTPEICSIAKANKVDLETAASMFIHNVKHGEENYQGARKGTTFWHNLRRGWLSMEEAEQGNMLQGFKNFTQENRAELERRFSNVYETSAS